MESGEPNRPGLLLRKAGDVLLFKTPLLAFFEARQDVFASEFVDGIRAQIEDDGDLAAVQEFFFALQR